MARYGDVDDDEDERSANTGTLFIPNYMRFLLPGKAKEHIERYEGDVLAKLGTTLENREESLEVRSPFQ